MKNAIEGVYTKQFAIAFAIGPYECTFTIVLREVYIPFIAPNLFA